MAKKTDGSFFTKILIASAIFLGGVLTYSYIIGNSIQPQSGVVEKIYTGIFSSADTFSGEHKQMSFGFDIDSHIKIKQESTVLLDGELVVQNAQFYADKSGLEQSVSADSIQLDTNIRGDKKQYNVEQLEIVTQDEHVYFSSKGFEQLADLFGFSPEAKQLFRKISQINESGKYAHIDNSQPIENTLSKLGSDHVIISLLTALTTSNPGKYYEENNISNLLKQRLYNDKWIDYIFKKNEKISDTKTHYFLLDKNMCDEISPFLDLVSLSQSGSTSRVEGVDNCEKYIGDINPFISLVGQIYKNGDIENGNYDFVISQGSQLDIRFKYSHHILQTWNIFLQNPENTFKISILGDKFGIKESQIDIDYQKDKSIIKGNIVNGTGDIAINIDEKDTQIEGGVVFQKYLLLDMDMKGRGETEEGDMRFLAQGDYKSGKIDYTVKNDSKIVHALDIKYTDKKYKIDYISPNTAINSLYATGKFILGYSEKLEDIVQKEFKYVYDTGKVTGHYRTGEFEGNIQGEVLSKDTFILDLGMKHKQQDLLVKAQAKQVASDIVEYSLDGTMGAQQLFSMTAQKVQKSDTSHITASADIPDEKINISFDLQVVKNPGEYNYNIPKQVEKVDIKLDQIIPIFNLHHLCLMDTAEMTFAGAGVVVAAGTQAYLSLIGNSREERNTKVLADIEAIDATIKRFIETQTGAIQYRDFIEEVEKDNKQAGIRIGGDKLFPGDEYMVGSINYGLFALDKSVIEQDDIQYKIAILNLPETQTYQILGFLDEVGSKQKVITKGNYVPREFVRYDFEIVIPEDAGDDKGQSSIQIKINSDHHLKIGDVTNLGRILDIVDGVIFIENAVNPDISKIYLLGNDSPTLFINKNSAFEAGEIIIKK